MDSSGVCGGWDARRSDDVSGADKQGVGVSVLDDAKKQSQKRMIKYLCEQLATGEIDNDWESDFIRDMGYKVNSVFFYLTEEQDEVLTRLFERY